MTHDHRARLGASDQTLYLLDISSFIFRAFFAIRHLTNKAGEPTNAVYGVATMMSRLVEEAKPEYLCVVYDSKEPSFRKEIFPDYKANRSAPPDELIPQFARIEQLIASLKLYSCRQSGVEADDLIATLTKKWLQLSGEHRVVVVSSDKDLMQLVGDRVCVWDTMNDKIYGATEVNEKFGVEPHQIRDYLALVGDSSDNIPGVAGIGPKGAAELLRAHQTLDGILQAAKNGKISGKKGETLVAHESDARLSAQLATVHEDLETDLSIERARYSFQVTPECERLLTDLDFHSLLVRWKKDAASLPSAVPPGESPTLPSAVSKGDGEFHAVTSEKDLSRLLAAMEKRGEFGFDLETTSLDPARAELVGIAIAVDASEGFYIPVGHRVGEESQLPLGYVLEKLKPFIEDPRYKKIGQNLKYDFSVLIERGFRPDGIGADTMVAAYVLDAEGRHNLQTLAAQYLGYTVLTYEEVCGKGANQLGFDQIPIAVATRYSAEDAMIALRLWEVLKPKLEQESLMPIFAQIDLPLVSVLTRMEREGVCIDVGWLEKVSREFEKELHGIEQRVSAFTKTPVNLNSPKQLAQLLFEELKLPVQNKTKTGYSTDARVLEILAPLHEVPRLLLEYREISKLKGTYVDPLPGLRSAKTGKIHASFHQTVAATGRLSSSDPNLQNIPIRTERGRMIRRAFIPSPGQVLLSVDYSQIELRLLAHMSGDEELVRSFQTDEDVHRRTASEIFRVKPEEVDDRQRGIAKAVNFGLMYGKTAFGLAQELHIPRREAQDVIDRYFERYQGVKRFLDHLIIDAKEKGFTSTLSGRKRALPDLKSSNAGIRNNAERMAMNSPIQGTAADLMKIAMIELDHRLSSEGLRSKLIIQVHDEVVLDCPQSEVEQVRKLVTQVMEGAMKLSVPLRVNSAVGENWMDL